MAVISESSEHSRIAAFTCTAVIVSKLNEIMHKVNKVIVWSDGCASQFRSKFLFSLMTYFDRSVHFEWHYNEAHHGKGTMNCVGSTIKRVLFGLVKSGKIVINTAEDFAREAEKAVPYIATIFLSVNDEIIEPASVDSAPAIKGTLNVHKISRSFNQNGVCYLEVFELSTDPTPFNKQFYRRPNEPIVCDHAEATVVDSNHCGHCPQVYKPNDKLWLKCPVCNIWFHEKCFEE